MELKDLMNCKMRHDDLKKFQADWDMCLLCQSRQHDELLLHTLYFAQIAKHRDLREDMAYYRGLKSTSRKKSYHWLRETVRKLLSRQRQDRTTSNWTKDYSHGVVGHDTKKSCNNWTRTGK